ncbi:protein MIZU-KUSSEI 1-like [Malania oleifera]|uniref:protein MIZU-KUSSEI 1-like n=1 Tax=Malania oleifera TaxID=397392 RepID=UPI0025AE9630|nr:protein MIZU-KUSSEI 1-like [Malania oleifera]
MPYATVGATAVECHKHVRSWRLLRSFIELLIPCCRAAPFTAVDRLEIKEERNNRIIHSVNFSRPTSISSSASASAVTGTIFGYRGGNVSFCIQTDPRSTAPLLLLELAVPAAVLAREMQSGILRITLECADTAAAAGKATAHSGSLLSEPLWVMHCNEKRVGFAAKRRPGKADEAVLRRMRSVGVGAGVTSGKEFNGGGELMYLRANFERIRESPGSESFHLVDPEGSIGQELSFYFIRSG